MSGNKMARLVRDLLETGLFSLPEGVGTSRLAADGSSRQFIRLTDRDLNSCICVLPPTDDPAGLREANGFYMIGNHLKQQGVPVPEMYGYAPGTGMVICEDLGDTRLHDLVVANGCADLRVIGLYEQVVRQLARMQTAGLRGFDQSWCWDTRVYDRSLMLERESGYFLHALCLDYFKLEVNIPAVQADFESLATTASRAPTDYFLHRDLQSRNIMVKEGEINFIDFQGGRRGPLGYDLASLILDPYAGLQKETGRMLINAYLDELSQICAYDEERFREEYQLLAIQRNLQILGAFAFLTRTRGKPFFRAFIRPALISLDELLTAPGAVKFEQLRGLVGQCLEKIEKIDEK